MTDAALFRPRLLVPAVFFIVLAVSLAPYLVLGTQANVAWHDHLDSNFSWAAVLAHENQVFASATEIVSPILGGLERQYLGSPFTVYFWVFAIFSEPFAAMIVVEALVRSIAFIGAYALVSKFVAPEQQSRENIILTVLLAACYALLPFWPPGGAAVAGLPLFFWAALTLRHSWPGRGEAAAVSASIAIFVLFGSLILSGFFALVFLTLLIVWDLLQGRYAKAFRLTVFNTLTSILFIWQNAWLFALSASGAPTTRSEFVTGTQPWTSIPDLAWTNFRKGQFHADPGTDLPMFIAVLAALVLLSRRRSRSESYLGWAFSRLSLALVALVFTAIVYGAQLTGVINSLFDGTTLAGFNFGRFHWLQPLLWFLALAIAAFAIKELPNRRRLGVRAVFVLVSLQVAANVYSLPVYSSSKGRYLPYEVFLLSETFEAVRAEITERPRLGLIGLHPAVAQLNGFGTVGGYVPIYGLETKHRFREIIADELEQDDSMRRYFDNWGSRAYLFSAELQHCQSLCFADIAPEEIETRLDIRAFREFGGTHLLSVSRLSNAERLGIRYVNSFEHGTGRFRWNLHLYDARGSAGG